MQHLALCLPAALVLIEGFSYEVRNVESRHLPPTDLQAISADTPPPEPALPQVLSRLVGYREKRRAETQGLIIV